jgi:hypothetical protein
MGSCFSNNPPVEGSYKGLIKEITAVNIKMLMNDKTKHTSSTVVLKLHRAVPWDGGCRYMDRQKELVEATIQKERKWVMKSDEEVKRPYT